ncbi:TonB-dependent receptor [Desulfofustis glycolicus]|uniref:TonB-dependent Receptor Plug Domain n=1 Tax=Desulfofustis glycolicus DSM 9705 TaxID=1121409 RepID=A0A1M5X1L8_9BACT|nr:TonB-dependent receptor [Desulfofustis glycolicus]SHH93364.1 TonB-dependent Receptor Plug Domain [Desulfofustis glycolicus DSM 9705]
MPQKCFTISCLLTAVLFAGSAAAETGQPIDRPEEIVVTGTRTPHALKDAPVETILINRADIERTNAQTIGDMLKAVPGINTSGIDDVFGDGTSRVRLQGLDFNNGYGLVLIDGQRVHGSGQSGAHGEYAVGLNQIPVAMIDNSDGTRTTVNKDVVTWSIFAQDEITLFDHLTLIPGVRLDHHSTFGSSVNPKLSLMYRLTDSTTFRGAVGRAFKSPTIRQLYYDVPFYHSPFWIQSNPDLDPETSIGYSLGVEQWLLNDTLIVNLGLFRNDVDDLVVSETADEMFNGEELRIYRNVEQAMTQGAELTARLLLGNDFIVSASYTYTDSENKESGNELTYTPNHQITIAPTYEYAPWGLGGSALLSYNSRQ